MPNIEKKILRTVEYAIDTRRMVQAGDTLLVAVSGGPDSVALVHILLALAPKFSFQVAIAHLNHCLRDDESERDEAFVVSLAEQLELPGHVERQDVRRYQKSRHLSLEEAARQVRYGFYHAIAAKYGYEKIALGHHSDDNWRNSAIPGNRSMRHGNTCRLCLFEWKREEYPMKKKSSLFHSD